MLNSTRNMSSANFRSSNCCKDLTDSMDDDGTDRGMAFSYVFLISGLIPIVFLLIIPFCGRCRNKQRSLEDAEQRLMSTKLAKPICQTYLLNLLRDYSMVLSKSDIYDNYDSEQDEGSCIGATIETCGESLTSSSPSDTDKPEYESQDEDVDDTLHHNDDIEMQRPKASSEVEEEEEDDANNLECDNSQCRHRTIFIPQPGRKVEECANDESENNSKLASQPASAAIVTKKQAHSDECAVCLNPFEVGQRVAWSSNPDCPHVFHHECLLEWFAAVGIKAWEKAEKKRRASKEKDDREASTIQKQICKFPTLCPYCRRDYFLDGIQETKDSDITDTDTDNNSSTATSSSSAENEEEYIESAAID